MKVLLEFKDSHHYFQYFSETNYYCMHCGKQEVWLEDGPGDYYVGENYYCTSCDHGGYGAGLPRLIDDPPYKAMIDQLNVKKCDEPTTKLPTVDPYMKMLGKRLIGETVKPSKFFIDWKVEDNDE